MTGAAALRHALASLVLIAAGCEAANHQPRRQAVAILAPTEQPVALATLEVPFLSGSRGRVAGYIRGWPFAVEEPTVDARDPLFTYVIDFRIIETSPLFRRPQQAEGVRRIYFHPGGVRIAFGDLSRFINGDPIVTERVRFSFDFAPDFRQVTLKMLVSQISARPFNYNGRTITPPTEREDSFDLFGRFSTAYGGFLLTGAGA